ncbi:MAG: hypothetical protein KBT21_05505 [Treponema sp.]|nr:hypothetical protein [Candidatus Treponema merdequi]
MTDIKLDEIPQLLKSKKLSFEKACLAVYEIIYREPFTFDLADFDEDERSDFLLFFLQKKIPALVQKFNSDITTFGCYVYTVLKMTKLDYKQKIIKNNNNHKTYIQESILDYDEILRRSQESVYPVSETNPEYIPQTEEEKIPQLVYKKFFKSEHHRLCVAESKERKLKRGILILALKSAWYINDDQIKKVSNYCKISSEIISSTICELKAGLINKAILREEIQNNRAKAYCLINNYEMQLKNSGSYEGLPKFTRLEKRLEFQKKNFIQKNRLLRSGRCKIAPTNTEIAKVIGVPNSIIANVLSRFRKLDLNFNDRKI